MPIVSISQGLSSDDLHVTALGCKTVEEADIILNHPQCAETTRQMVVAKIKLFDKKEFNQVDENYHSDIVAVAKQKNGG
ncbi:MAG TPA: hypothetical protein PLX67_00690 [bacterium]|jgi:hypothetical protein|nr:hypothetical protein [bacterium]HNZ51425.1 hypothetical protein [bacterium]HOF79394.1 hypothetical protein [bacterium]HOH85582.1 hypothetical protein [bacterium]HOQ91483.1 hypothetical protein [bacterium]